MGRLIFIVPEQSRKTWQPIYNRGVVSKGDNRKTEGVPTKTHAHMNTLESNQDSVNVHMTNSIIKGTVFESISQF